MKKKLTKTSLALSAVAAALLLAGCGSGDGGTVNGDVPMAYVQRSTSISMNPTDGTSTAAGGDLIVRGRADGSASETNVTDGITGAEGDVSDPEASYDGKKIVFALRCPAASPVMWKGVRACTGRWNIWEYDMTTGGYAKGDLRRITSSTQYDDVDPAYLPGNAGFVFSSNRQQVTRANQALGRSYGALDEYERETVINLHTMDANGGNIQQISSNQSHDRNPVVTSEGDIMFSRWEHVGDRNRFAIFTVKPDGKGMFVRYGAQSPGNSFLHPREMDPKGPYKGYYASSLMPLSRSQEGGALMIINAKDYSEQNTPERRSLSATGGQVQATPWSLNEERGFSRNGRITTPYPLWDGTNRILLAHAPCQVIKRADNRLVSCLDNQLTAQDIANMNNRERSMEDAANDTFTLEGVPAEYRIVMFNPGTGQWDIVATPPAGYMYTDPIPLQARTPPKTATSEAVDPDADVAALIAANQGTLEVRSVYDTDKLGRMSNSMLASADLAAGCTQGIAMTAAGSADTETRTQVADLATIKNPLAPEFKCSPLRFLRVTRAVAPPNNMMGSREAIGETDFEPQQILGYVPIEPDGSFKIKVPADTPIALSVIDTKGRAIQTHTNWIQVRPGETRTCNGCHSPRRGTSINTGDTATVMPAGLNPALVSAHTAGATMASTRTRAGQTLQPDMVFTDEWVDAPNKRPDITIRYTGNANPADDLATLVPATSGNNRGIINYSQHIAPLWTRTRTGGSCISCHADPAKLDLSATIAGTGRVQSYEQLVLGDPVIGANGLPQTRIEEGVPVIVRGAALVETSSSFAGSAGGARKSRLTEILFGERLKAGDAAYTAHPDPQDTGGPDHSTMLNLAEKRVLTEWIDLGGQYFNDPFDPAAGTAPVTLTEASFVAQIQPILRANCASACHMAVGSAGTPAGTAFHQNRFVLTGSAEGDFHTTLSMISNVCAPANNLLLSRPSTIPHPAGAGGQATAVLPVGSANYNTIRDWIATGCP